MNTREAYSALVRVAFPTGANTMWAGNESETKATYTVQIGPDFFMVSFDAKTQQYTSGSRRCQGAKRIFQELTRMAQRLHR